jgi:hypothetical protein
MANSVKLLNYVDPDGDFIKFYTELNSDIIVGDKVFIVGGSYDNTNLAITDPYNEFAAGYTVIAADLTNISNSITLNIKYNDLRFSNNPTSTLFEPLSVYQSRTESFININNNNEAFITKNRFIKGEFNGGRFLDGVFGEYQRYEKNEEILYKAEITSSNIDITSLNDIETYFYNYNVVERPIPIEEFKTYFNRKNENEPAILSGGIFLGGNWQWGEWNTKYPSNQIGKVQQLNALGGIRNPLDESKFNIAEFTNNYNNLGYNIVSSGNFGQVWKGYVGAYFDAVNNQIVLDFIPYVLKRSLRNGFNVQLDIEVLVEYAAYRNSKKFLIDFNPTPNSSDFTLLNSNILRVYEKIYDDPSFGTDAFRSIQLQILISDPDQVLLSDPAKRKISEIAPLRKSKRNRFLTGRSQDSDFFNGLWRSGQYQGGEFWGGEFISGRIGSELRRTTWHDGHFNSTINTGFANDVFWIDGVWNDGAWEGARNFRVNALIKLPIINGIRNTNLQLDYKWENMFKVGEIVLLSYFKNSNSTLYLNNWSNDYKENLLEFQSFTILNITRDFENKRLLLTIDLDLDIINNINLTTNVLTEQIVDINYQFARVSNSYFANGTWNNGNWQNGYFNGNLKPLSIVSYTQNTLTIQVADVTGLKSGQMIGLTNIKLEYQFNYITLLGSTLGTAAGGVDVDDRPNVEYWLNLQQSLAILDIDIFNNLIILDLSTVLEIIQEDVTIVNVAEYYPNENDKRPGLTGYTTQIWNNGTFNTGVWENGVWKDGIFKNIFVEDPTNAQNKSIWRSGVWLNGNWNGGVFLSGIWEAGVWVNGIMTNGWKRSTTFWNVVGSWQQGDSIWYNGEWMNGRWLRGVWKDGIFENGTIENAGIDEIEIVNGSYLNGKLDNNGNTIFSNELNINNTLNSAPSLIFIDQEGWVQMDQSSWYQIDYNVIIKDLTLRPNVFNDQMFNVLNRNKTASQIRISIAGANGTNGVDIPQNIIDNSLPIVVIRDIVDIIESDPNVFWFADTSYKRIIEVDENFSPKKIRAISKIINDEIERADLVYGQILKMTTDNVLDQNNLTRTRYTYVLETTRLIRINKDTLALEIIITFATLQQDSTINLVEWIDIFVYPAKIGISETVFILAKIKVDLGNSFQDQFKIISYNIDTKIYAILEYTGALINDATILNEWLTGLTANNLNLNDLKIKGFSLGDALNLFYKLPIDILSNSRTFNTNNIQRQRLSFVNNAWTISEYQINVIPNVSLLIGNTAYLFKDFAVRVLSPAFRYFLLSSNGLDIYYTKDNNSLIPLVTNVNVENIDFGINKILSIRKEFGENMSPVIIPQQTKRFGAINRHSDIRVLESVNSLPLPNTVVQWYVDQPTNRLLKLQEAKAPFLYDSIDEYGIENVSFNKILYITNTINFNRLVYIEEDVIGLKFIKYFNKIGPSTNTINVIPSGPPNASGPPNDLLIYDFELTAIGTTSVFKDAYYYQNYLYILYTHNSLYFYDIYRVDGQLTDHKYNLALPFSDAIKISHAGESIGNQTISIFTDNRIVYFSNQTTIKDNNNNIIFGTVPNEKIIDFGFFITNQKKYLYVATFNDQDQYYRIIRVSKKYFNSTVIAWPGDNYTGNNNTYDVVYISTTPIETLYSNVGFIEKMVVNSRDRIDLLSLEYSKNQLQKVNNLIFNDEITYWVGDSSSRVVNYNNYGTSGNIKNLDFGQYKQPFEFGKYIRNANSIKYLEWAGNKYLIFIDEDFNSTKKELRAIDLVANALSDSEDVEILTMLSGNDDVINIKDLFGDYYYAPVFVPFGTNGTAGTAGTSGFFIPPGLVGTENYELVDIWTKNISETGVLKMLVRNINNNDNYIMSLYHTTQGATSLNYQFISSSQNFRNLSSNSNDLTNDVFLSTNNEIYSFISNNLTLIQTLPENIDNLFVNYGTAGIYGTSGYEHIYAISNSSTNTNGRLYRIDKNNLSYNTPVFDDNSTIFDGIDWAESDYDLDRVIIKTNYDVNRIKTSSVNNIISGIIKVAKFGNNIFAHTSTKLIKLNTTTVNYVELEITSIEVNIKKVVALTDNLCYALYANGVIVEYDFSLLTATVLAITPIYYDPAYYYTAVDIAKQSGKLAILYRILSFANGQSQNNSYCDVWLYDTAIAGTNGFAKQNFSYDFSNDPLDPQVSTSGFIPIYGTTGFSTSGFSTSGFSTSGTSGTSGLIVPIIEAIIDVIANVPYDIYDNGRDYSFKGQLLNGNNINLWVYSTSGYAWKVDNQNTLVPFINNLLSVTSGEEFDIIADDIWAIKKNQTTFIANDNQFTYNTVTQTTDGDIFTFAEVINFEYCYNVTDIVTSQLFVLIPKQTFNWSITSSFSLTPGKEVFEINSYPTTPLVDYTTEFDGTAIFKSYSAFNTSNVQISPHVSGRVLYNTIWRNGQFNVGVNSSNSAYTAHLVSSRWLSGTFKGSWDTPDYIDHMAIREESVFLGGSFGEQIFGDSNSSLTAIWNDGLFLGGTWKSGQFNDGHFFAENQILIENIIFPNLVINQITDARWDYNRQMFKIEIDHIKWNPTTSDYEKTLGTLAKYNLIQIPGLFNQIRINILELRKNKYSISGFDEIILICTKPLFEYTTNWLENQYIYISGLSTYVEYLYGEHFVTDSFTYQNQLWITIRSNFNRFNAQGKVVFTTNRKPYIGIDLLRIQDLTFSTDSKSSTIWFNLPVSSGEFISQVNFIKSALIIESLDIIADTFIADSGTNGTAGTAGILTVAQDYGAIVIDETLQVFSRSVNGGNNSISINSTTLMNTILLNNVTSVNYTGTTDLYDLTVYNSNINSTSNTTVVNFNILNSLFMSGSTNIPTKNVGWLNKDAKGFSFSNSSFSGLSATGDWGQILNFEIDQFDNQLFVLELLKPLDDLNPNQYIYVRGFSGNKANQIGSAISRAFRVVKIEQNKIFIKNPFRLYNQENIVSDRIYRTAFDSNELITYTQAMNLRRDLIFDFKYAYVSTNAWNGGKFIGKSNIASKFKGIWNAGDFSPINLNSTFEGEWFSTPLNYYWSGQINVIVTQTSTSFKFEMNLASVGIDWENGSLVRIDFLNSTPSGFYNYITNGKVSNLYQIFYNSGLYTVNIVLLRRINKTLNVNDLVIDRNLAIGPEPTSQSHLVFDKNIYNWETTNNATFFNGIINYNITYVTQAINSVNNEIVFDLWLNPTSTITALPGNPIISFKLNNADFTIFTAFDGSDYLINIQYSLNTVSYIRTVKVITNNWHHLYVQTINNIFKFVLDGNNDFVIINPTGTIIDSANVWTITSLNYSNGYVLNRSSIREISIGRNKFINASTLHAVSGAIDQIRFWNKQLSDEEIALVKDSKFLAKRFKDIAAQITFDDPAREFANINDDKLRISMVEYVSNVVLREPAANAFLIYLDFEFEQLETYTPLIKFSNNKIQNLGFEKPYIVLATNAGNNIALYMNHELTFSSFIIINPASPGLFPVIALPATFYSSTNINNKLFSYEAESSNGFSNLSEHGFTFIANTAVWSIAPPRFVVKFVNDGINSYVEIQVSYGNALTTVFATQNLSSLIPPQQIVGPFSKYSVSTTINDIGDLKINVIVNFNIYALPVLSLTIPNPFPINAIIYVAACSGSYITKFKNRKAEDFQYLNSVEYGVSNKLYITQDRFILNKSTSYADLTEFNLDFGIFNIGNKAIVHFGDDTVSNISSLSLIKYNVINIYKNPASLTLESINNLIIGDNTDLNLLSFINQENYQSYSDYFIIYPNIGDYGVVIQSSGTAGTAGIITEISGYGTPAAVTNFKYFLGDGLSNLRKSDQYGTNLEIYPAPVTPLDYVISETFILKTDGTPRWTIDQVTFTSSFNNGNYVSKIWRAGVFNNGIINVGDFIWKWGISNGGTISDPGV